MAKRTTPEINWAIREWVRETRVQVDDLVRAMHEVTGDEKINQSSVYRWIHSKGGGGPSICEIPRIEDGIVLASGLYVPRGEIFRRANDETGRPYVETPSTIESMIDNDPKLAVEYRTAVADAYRAAVARTEMERTAVARFADASMSRAS